MGGTQDITPSVKPKNVDILGNSADGQSHCIGTIRDVGITGETFNNWDTIPLYTLCIWNDNPKIKLQPLFNINDRTDDKFCDFMFSNLAENAGSLNPDCDTFKWYHSQSDVRFGFISWPDQ